MVEDLRRYAQALSNSGYEEGALELMVFAESLAREGKLPKANLAGVRISISKLLVPQLEKQPEVLTIELAEKLREVTGTVSDDFDVVNLLEPKSHSIIVMEQLYLGHHLEIIPPPHWLGILQGLSKKERVAVGSALGKYCLSGMQHRTLYNAGTIRRTTAEELVHEWHIGKATANFIKTAFEPKKF